MDPKRNASGTLGGAHRSAIRQSGRPDGKGHAGASQPGAPGAGGAGGNAGGKSTLPEAIDRVARDIQQMRVDFERFFAGALPLPPEELRSRIEKQLRSLRNTSQMGAVESFRLGDQEARFISLNELYNRRLRESEEGRRKPHAPPRVPHAQTFDVHRGVVLGEKAEPAAVAALYQGLASAGEGPRFDLASFSTYLERQAASIRQKTGCSQVQFRLAEEDGRMRLKARPVGLSSARAEAGHPKS